MATSPVKSKDYSNSEMSRPAGTGPLASAVPKFSTDLALLVMATRTTVEGARHTMGVAPHSTNKKKHTYLAPYPPASVGSARYTTVARDTSTKHTQMI